MIREGLVSIIVNVYNCKEYLPISLESIRKQTYQEFEVILVDDCSTDGSGAFCDTFSQRDNRFRVIHHERNMGVSGPRNTGLKAAIGEYVYFMDSDDYLHEKAIEVLVNAIQATGLDLAVVDFYETDSLEQDTHQPLSGMAIESIAPEQMIFEMLSLVELKWCVSWNKLYKHSLIDGIFFNDYYSIEDQDFNIRVYKKIEKAAFVPVQLYWYYKNPNSMQRKLSLYPKRYYLNTIYRFRMLDYLSKSERMERKYRAWVIDYGYRQMLDRRDFLRGTEYENVFSERTKVIIRKTIGEFYSSLYIRFIKKVRFSFFWFFPRLGAFYLSLRKQDA